MNITKLLLSLGITPFFLTLFLFAACTNEAEENRVVTGAERFIELHLDELSDKRIGLVMNPTARIGDTHMLDTLLALNANVKALFAPEHGFRGEAGAGDHIEDGIDQASGLPVFSLYGQTRKPTPEMLGHVDVLLFDMQDVGARFYTYIATLGLVLEAASEAGLPVWVLDRPNPMGGNFVSGWILEKEFESFVGLYPIPIAHGLTMGEMARMIAGESWMNFTGEPDLNVVEMSGWSRDMIWPDTGLEWVAPSPNLPTFDHAFIYTGTVYFEGTTMSEGRGTENPFLTLGDPNTSLHERDWEILASLEGVRIVPHLFTPRSIPGVAPNPKHLDVECVGVLITIDSYDFDPVRTGLVIFKTLLNATEGAETNNFLYRLAGTRKIDELIEHRLDAMELNFSLQEFKDQRAAYLLY